MIKRGLNKLISLLIGLIIFGFFLYKVGPEAISLIAENINIRYLFIYFVITTLTFFPIALRWQVILRAYKKRIPFLTLLRYTIAGHAVSYITPSIKLGGEPLRAYMLKKEANVDLRTGSSSIIIDKFVELAGTAVFGLIGLFLLISIPGLSVLFKVFFVFLILLAFYILFMLYYRTVTKKGSFSSLFNLFKLYKIPKFKNFVNVLEDIEKRMGKFFLKNKKEFLLAFLFYVLYGVLIIFEFKFLLLSFGINESITVIILVLTILGLVSFVPVPAGLGFLEAGQSTLFFLLRGEGSIGFALTLLMRTRALFFVAVGFTLISYFSGKQIEKIYRKNI